MTSKLTKILCCIFFMIITVSCSGANSIELYDYKNIEIDKEYVEVSEKDIESIILLDYSSSDFYKLVQEKNVVGSEDIVLIDLLCQNKEFQIENYYYKIGEENISDDLDKNIVGKHVNDTFKQNISISENEETFSVVIKGIYKLPDTNDQNALMEFYSMSSVDEVYNFIRSRAKEEIIFNYMWDKILENSEIHEIPKNIKNMISKINLINNAVDGNDDKSDTQISQDDYDFIYELTIAQTILTKEKVYIQDSDINDEKAVLANKNKISVADINNYFTDLDIYYAVTMDKLKPILTSYAKII
ncbi:MAG: hypothetical protein ACI4GY_03850 [Acutalibacteraceae bacterium]